MAGRGDRKIACDGCGFTYKVSEVILVTAEYSRQKGLILCKKKCYDGVQPYDRPHKPLEDIFLARPELVRPESPINPIPRDNDNRVPGKPTNGHANYSMFEGGIKLTWQGPVDTGSSPIIGYQVRRYDPQGVISGVIIENTNIATTEYLDTTAVLGTFYSYDVAAINGAGMGAFSSEFYYPTYDWDTVENTHYLLESTTGKVLLTGDGFYITLPLTYPDI